MYCFGVTDEITPTRPRKSRTFIKNITSLFYPSSSNQPVNALMSTTIPMLNSPNTDENIHNVTPDNNEVHNTISPLSNRTPLADVTNVMAGAINNDSNNLVASSQNKRILPATLRPKVKGRPRIVKQVNPVSNPIQDAHVNVPNNKNVLALHSSNVGSSS